MSHRPALLGLLLLAAVSVPVSGTADEPAADPAQAPADAAAIAPPTEAADPFPDWRLDTPLLEVLVELGAPRPPHWRESPDPELVRQGRDLATRGWTFGEDGSRSEQQSRHFVCTDCHNLEQEDPDLASADPQARLDYAVQTGQAFLPGTTMYGTVNRDSWFNGDYLLKYGEELIGPANRSLVESLQLCSEFCSSGRRLEEWEIEALLAYLWTLQLRLSDLGLTASELQEFRTRAGAPGRDGQALINWLQERYLVASPATFAGVVEDREAGYGLEGDPENGAAIYTLTCATCHGPEGPAEYRILPTPGKARELNRYITRDHDWSIYHAIREGTHPSRRHPAYMPRFTLERMSDQQIEDLRAYIEQLSAE